jgi:hypothetical protein
MSQVKVLLGQERVLQMRRPGKEGEKAYHFHTWELVAQDPETLTFKCVRCRDTQKVPTLIKPYPDWTPWAVALP